MAHEHQVDDKWQFMVRNGMTGKYDTVKVFAVDSDTVKIERLPLSRNEWSNIRKGLLEEIAELINEALESENE